MDWLLLNQLSGEQELMALSLSQLFQHRLITFRGYCFVFLKEEGNVLTSLYNMLKNCIIVTTSSKNSDERTKMLDQLSSAC